MAGRKTSKPGTDGPLDVDLLIDLIGAGLTAEQIGERLGCTTEMVREELTRLAISPKTLPAHPPHRFWPMS